MPGMVGSAQKSDRDELAAGKNQQEMRSSAMHTQTISPMMTDLNQHVDRQGQATTARYVVYQRPTAGQMVPDARQTGPTAEVPLNLYQTGPASHGRAWIARAGYSLAILILAFQVLTHLIGS